MPDDTSASTTRLGATTNGTLPGMPKAAEKAVF